MYYVTSNWMAQEKSTKERLCGVRELGECVLQEERDNYVNNDMAFSVPGIQIIN